LNFCDFINAFHSVSSKKQTTQKTTTTATPVILVDLDVDIVAPLVYLPRFSSSKTCLAADLGRIIITNNFSKSKEEADENNGPHDLFGVDTIEAKLKDVELYVYVSYHKIF